MEENCSDITVEEECVVSENSGCHWLRTYSEGDICSDFNSNKAIEENRNLVYIIYTQSAVFTIIDLFFFVTYVKGRNRQTTKKSIILFYTLSTIGFLAGIIYPSIVLLKIIPELKEDETDYNYYLNYLNNPHPIRRPEYGKNLQEIERDQSEIRRAKEEIKSLILKLKKEIGLVKRWLFIVSIIRILMTLIIVFIWGKKDTTGSEIERP